MEGSSELLEQLLRATMAGSSELLEELLRATLEGGFRKTSAPSGPGSLYVFSSVLTLANHEDSAEESNDE